MIPPAALFEALTDRGMSFFTGVPDSLLKDFCAYVNDHAGRGHIIAANEGNAVALATGWYLGTGKPALVYMQNSGIGNAVNPLMSLADPEVYGIPMLIIIGWRGEPGTKDEPQHLKQGRITPSLLDSMEIPWFLLDQETEDLEDVIAEAFDAMMWRGGPVALLVRANAFQRYSPKPILETYPMSREEALKVILDCLDPKDIIVSTTGKTSRELYECREARGEGHESDFLTVGSMGHASSIAMGLARARTERRVICIDGDGAIIMHMGAMATIGQKGPGNLVHIVMNNGVHDSVGGQPTVGFDVDMVSIATGCGYRAALSVWEKGELRGAIDRLLAQEGPAFLEVRVRKGARKDLGRPTTSPRENREALMSNLRLRGR
jgi:phosphonopyruvate decarboxylase